MEYISLICRVHYIFGSLLPALFWEGGVKQMSLEGYSLAHSWHVSWILLHKMIQWNTQDVLLNISLSFFVSLLVKYLSLREGTTTLVFDTAMIFPDIELRSWIIFQMKICTHVHLYSSNEQTGDILLSKPSSDLWSENNYIYIFFNHQNSQLP